ncbi:hypothetical protein FHR51_002531 [Xanthomonas arboricola]|uniref:hypothetical protein n=1 Tax=Xanthomonas cannabis TaxID=1885674 RepID=UPI0016071D8D|nr:hypothetical protein [Xanthomonas cannabis]MBB3806379.1 hypothetical protein [Xanthomonas cannabis]
MSTTFCAAPIPTLVYASPATREEFDRLPLPATQHDWKADSTLALIKGDGQQWQRRCTSKVLGEHARDSVTVIFQWFDERVAVEESELLKANADLVPSV